MSGYICCFCILMEIISCVLILLFTKITINLTGCGNYFERENIVLAIHLMNQCP